MHTENKRPMSRIPKVTETYTHTDATKRITVRHAGGKNSQISRRNKEMDSLLYYIVVLLSVVGENWELAKSPAPWQ